MNRSAENFARALGAAVACGNQSEFEGGGSESEEAEFVVMVQIR